MKISLLTMVAMITFSAYSMELAILSSDDEGTHLLTREHSLPRDEHLALQKTSRKERRALLLQAASHGETAKVRALLSFKTPFEKLIKPLIDTQDNGNNTPLHLAAREGRKDTVALLLDQDKSLSSLTAFNQKGIKKLGNAGELSPLHLAAANNHVAVVRCILEHAALTDTVAPWVKYETKGDVTAFEMAANRGHEQVITLMLEKAHNHIDETALNVSWLSTIESGYENLVHILYPYCSVAQFYTMLRATNGTKALQIAARQGHLSIIEFLILKQETSLTIDPHEHTLTPLHCAAIGRGRNKDTAACCEMILKGAILQTTHHDILAWLQEQLDQGFEFTWKREAIITFMHDYFLKKITNLCSATDEISYTPHSIIPIDVVIELPGSTAPTPLKTIIDPDLIHMYLPKLIERWFKKELSSLEVRSQEIQEIIDL